jgi:TolB-like protein
MNPTKGFRFVLIFVLLLALGTIVFAGDVITQNDLNWAKEAIRHEKSLDAAPSGNNLAVLYFSNKSGNAEFNPLQKGFAFMLMTDLAEVPGINLLERVKLQALVEELKMSASGVVDVQTAPRMGKLLRANYIVGGELSSMGSTGIEVSSYVLGVKAGEILGKPMAQGELDNIFDLEKQLLFGICDYLNITLSKEQKERLKKPFTTSYKALYYFSLGLDSSDRGNYRQAAVYYKKARMADPGLKPAIDATRQLQSLKLAPVNVRSDAAIKEMESQNSQTASISLNTATFRKPNPNDVEKESKTGKINFKW